MSFSNFSFISKLVKSRKTYNELGQFDYKGDKYTKDLKEKKGKNKEGDEWIYIGQFESGTEIRNGIGIEVWDTGYTQNN